VPTVGSRNLAVVVPIPVNAADHDLVTSPSSRAVPSLSAGAQHDLVVAYGLDAECVLADPPWVTG
jgi:hypothetical protein